MPKQHQRTQISAWVRGQRQTYAVADVRLFEMKDGTVDAVFYDGTRVAIDDSLRALTLDFENWHKVGPSLLVRPYAYDVIRWHIAAKHALNGADVVVHGLPDKIYRLSRTAARRARRSNMEPTEKAA